MYGIRTRSHGRKRRPVEWDDLISNLTPYPTLVIPVMPDCSTTHAFCIVDDLIFDSSAQCALKLHMDSIRWILNGPEQGVHLALRFDTKYSQKGTKLEGEYNRRIRYEWSRVPLDVPLDDSMENDDYGTSTNNFKRKKK